MFSLFRQLKAAKERLHQLQTIVNQVNSIPGFIASLPDDVTAELNRQASADISATHLTASASSGLKTNHDVRLEWPFEQSQRLTWLCISCIFV